MSTLSPSQAAAIAAGVYLIRAKSMAAALDGLDALVFTGGIGEHAPVVRSRAASGLAFLGVGLDQAANERATTNDPPEGVAVKLALDKFIAIENDKNEKKDRDTQARLAPLLLLGGESRGLEAATDVLSLCRLIDFGQKRAQALGDIGHGK